MKSLLASQIIACVLCLVTSRAAELPTQPVLRIDPGMHTAIVKRISTDAAGRISLTVSNDKTARLWELPNGRLLRVLRPALGEGDEGKLYAGSLSPDGALAAVGGFTGAYGSKEHSVYLFDTTTGRPVRRLSGLPNVINDVAFSARGRFLAAVLGAGDGLRVWETATGREVGRDTDYGLHSSYSVDWHGDDRLVTTCFDGHLRLYRLTTGADGEQLALVKKSQVKGGKELISARFSPDGQRIAVGFGLSTAVAVVDGTDLFFVFAPDTAAVDHGNLGCVTWTDDGATLAAGGRWQHNGEYPIRRWQKSGRGSPQDSMATRQTFMDLRPLPGGRILFGASDPAWGVIDLDGRSQLLGASPVADYRALHENFRLSSDGATVAFTYEGFGKVPAQFSILGRGLTLPDDSPAATELRAPWPKGVEMTGGNRTTSRDVLHTPRLEGLEVTDWLNRFTTKLAGQQIPLNQGEASRSLAIARDASSFLLGTEWQLRSYTSKGTERWKAPAPGVWAVNLADNDHLAVAACGDGTIRWHRVDDGRELLSLFPHADRKRWVIWTPEGYYDCSPGAEDLIGWHLNRGKDQASDFFPASRFRSVYYRPDVVQQVLQTRDPDEALRQANAVLGRPPTGPEATRDVISRLSPPAVELATGGVLGTVKIGQDAASVQVEYSVRQTGREAPTKVSVRFNGRPVDVTALLPPVGTMATVTVPIPDGTEGEVSIIAEHQFGASEAALLRVRREGNPARTRQPDLYLVACGVAHFQMNEVGAGTAGSVAKTGKLARTKDGTILSFPDLRFAGDDARKLAEVLRSQAGKEFGKVFPRVLVDKEATTGAIGNAIEEVQRQARPGDVVLIYFSGHGHFAPRSGFYLITYDAQPERLAETALSGVELARRLSGIRGSVVLALDTCYSGAVLEGQKEGHEVTGPGDLTGFVNQLSSAEQGVVVLSSSGENQLSLESQTERQGLFTKALTEGLSGRAAEQGTVTCISLQKWLKSRVPELAPQTPVCIMPRGVPDFPLAKP